ncbi:MAG: porin [Terriglobia bacterium]
MKMVKSLLLGSVAGVVALAGAQAADLPVKARPVQYVKICSLYGAGFYYIPGTDTCIKIGGYVRAETNFNMGGSGSVPGTLNLNDRNEFNQDWRTRAAWSLDARSQTEFGTLRGYLFASATSDESGTSNSAAPAPNDHAGASGYVRLYAPAAFIQWAGFTFGKTDTFFDFDTMPYTNTTVFWGTNEGGNGVQVWAYTAQLGNGISATISAENAAAERNGIDSGSVYGAFTTAYAQQTWPDIVANLRVEQAWGGAQIMGAIHDVTAASDTVTGVHPGDAAGWAFGAGVKVNLPMIGKGDYVIAQGTYADGALRYITGSNGTGAAEVVTDHLLGAAPTIGFGPVFDAMGTSPTSMDLTKGWSVTGGVEHHWNPHWKTSLCGDYGKINYGTAASTVLAGAAGVSMDWSLWQIGSRTVWTPVENLDLSVEVLYNNIDSAASGVVPAGLYAGDTIANQHWVSAMIRAQRNFWP